MTENPYRLARDIRGIGFKTADAIAMKLGIEKTAMVRVRAGLCANRGPDQSRRRIIRISALLRTSIVLSMAARTAPIPPTVSMIFRSS